MGGFWIGRRRRIGDEMKGGKFRYEEAGVSKERE